MNLLISLENKVLGGVLDIPSSKSISNRVLLLDALADDSGKMENISKARDTNLMQELLVSDCTQLNAKDAGTTYRFMTSYLAIKERTVTELLGEERMYQRPIGILVDGLRALGGDIEYLGNEGYPPLRIKGKKLTSNGAIRLDGSVSSQFLSSLIMVGPYIENGLEIELIPPVASEPYLLMTLELMKNYGATYKYIDGKIKINEGTYKAINFNVESDWSGACFFYALSSLCDATFKIPNIYQRSLQADQVIVEIMDQLGVQSRYIGDRIEFRRQEGSLNKEITVDCLSCPDLVPALTVAISMLGIEGVLNNISHLKYKESDRGQALKDELEKTGVEISFDKSTMIVQGKSRVRAGMIFESYRDHRMAMCFSLLALEAPIIIKDAEVVEKSFPNYWEEMKKIGFTIDEI